MRISFDYDGTLATKDGIELALEYISQGNELWIITRRRKEFDDPVYKTAKALNIPRTRVVFTNGEMKWKYILDNNIELHIDNNPKEVEEINNKTNAEAILFE